MKNFSIINACSDFGVHVDGAKLGPEKISKDIKETEVNKKISNFYTLHAEKANKELDKNNKKKNLNPVNIFNTKLYNLVNDVVKNGEFPITLGGDHVIAIASALASINTHKNMGIIWVDAHGDYNTLETTQSGNLHGLPYAVITNYEKKLLADFHNGNFYNPKNAVILGGRDIDELELPNIKDAGVTLISTKDIQKYGVEAMFKKAIEIATNGTDGVHISYDLDIIDPKIAPGVSIPAIDGINLDDAYKIADLINKEINKDVVKSFDLVELNPLLDKNRVTEEIATQIIERILK
jgi:arginase